jgi:hypothetical protein
MGRKKLSSQIIPEKIFVVLSNVMFIIIFFNVNPSVRQLFLLLIPIYTGIYFIIFYLPDTLECNNDALYVKRKGAEFVVDLKDIDTIKLTSIMVGHRWLWKIKYSSTDEIEAVRFYRRYFSPSFGDFCRKVRLKNAEIDIVKFSWSFDFDI